METAVERVRAEVEVKEDDDLIEVDCEVIVLASGNGVGRAVLQVPWWRRRVRQVAKGSRRRLKLALRVRGFLPYAR